MIVRRNLIAGVLGLLSASTVLAGNPDRSGSAGATQLLINPFARSAGWSLANTASLRGVEAMFGNVAGLARVKKTEVYFSSTRWLEGSGVQVNSGGLGQKLGESGVLGFCFTSISYGELNVTSVDQPAGGIGTFRPSSGNVGIGLLQGVLQQHLRRHHGARGEREHRQRAHHGLLLRCRIHYVTGPTDNIHFGIALKNVGPPMRFSG